MTDRTTTARTPSQHTTRTAAPRRRHPTRAGYLERSLLAREMGRL